MSDQPEERIEETGIFAHLLGGWYPKHYIVRVIEDPAAADAREIGRASRGSTGPGKGALAALRRGVGSEEGVADLDYREAVEQGHSMLAVHAPTPDAVKRARAVLARFSARHLRYYGPLALTDLRG